MNVATSPRQEAVARTSLRAQSKLRTRRRVLDAARQLFMERGYEAATIRDIAAAADLSTGAVFASFSDKADLFNAVMAEDRHRMVDLLRQADRPDARVEDALFALSEAGYGFHAEQMPLLQAAVSLSWSQGLGGQFGDRPSHDLALDAVMTALHRGVERGELAKDADLLLLADVLWDAYVANYRRALFDGWSLPQLLERTRKQIALVLGGSRAAA